MKIKAWIQMGLERRETELEIPDEEFTSSPSNVGDIEAAAEKRVFEWMSWQCRWGWRAETLHDTGLKDDRTTLTWETFGTTTQSISRASGGPYNMYKNPWQVGVRVVAWIEMGLERRETVFEITAEELARLPEDGGKARAHTELMIEETVGDWRWWQFGWGWRGGDVEVDYTSHEGRTDGGSLAVTSEVTGPNTKKVRLDRMGTAQIAHRPQLGM